MIKHYWSRLVLANVVNKDKARRQFILHILLIGCITLSFIAFLKNSLAYIQNIIAISENSVLPPYITFSFFLFFLFLFILSKKGRIRTAAFLLLLFLYIGSMYPLIRWGADLPQALLICSLLIVMAGILLGTKSALFTTGIVSSSLLLITFLQVNKIYPPNVLWKKYPLEMGDTIVSIVTLGIIALVSFLFNRELAKALRRAQYSERALRRERDNLEVTVEQRTAELRQTQVDKMTQFYRFAEFGKTASGLFHDLANPLTLVSLNITKLLSLQDSPLKTQQLTEIKTALDRANFGIEKLKDFLDSARKQIQNTDTRESFSLREEIEQVILVLAHKAPEKNVTISFLPGEDFVTYGNPIKFHQVVANIIANAIDAYPPIRNKKHTRKVTITLEKHAETVRISIQDTGKGIKSSDLQRIFDPFFTTKGLHGTGIGLTISKDIIEKSFHGQITMESSSGKGTTVVITFSLVKKRKLKKI
ncbi:MAG: HAMP domain-containing sensor histidine kinase [Patescibacteria group bacterium]